MGMNSYPVMLSFSNFSLRQEEFILEYMNMPGTIGFYRPWVWGLNSVHCTQICVELGSCFLGVKSHYPWKVPCWGRCKLSIRRVNPSSINQQNGNMYIYIYIYIYTYFLVSFLCGKRANTLFRYHARDDIAP